MHIEHTSWRARAGPHGRFYTRSEDHLVAFEPFHAVKDELQAARKRYRLQGEAGSGSRNVSNWTPFWICPSSYKGRTTQEPAPLYELTPLSTPPHVSCHALNMTKEKSKPI